MRARTKIAVGLTIVCCLLLLIAIVLYSTYKSARRLAAQHAARFTDCVYAGTHLSYSRYTLYAHSGTNFYPVNQSPELFRLPYWVVAYDSTNPAHQFRRFVTLSEAMRKSGEAR